MSKEIFFFATGSDLIPGIMIIESLRELKYIKCGVYDNRDVKAYNSLLDYENFGLNISGNHQSESFLVLDRATELYIREVPQARGGLKYFVDQEVNKESIIIWPGGMFGNVFLVCGHIATIADNPLSQSLYGFFSKNIVKGFSKVNRYFIGPEALQLKKKIRFITMNVKQSSGYDLKLEM